MVRGFHLALHSFTPSLNTGLLRGRPGEATANKSQSPPTEVRTLWEGSKQGVGRGQDVTARLANSSTSAPGKQPPPPKAGDGRRQGLRETLTRGKRQKQWMAPLSHGPHQRQHPAVATIILNVPRSRFHGVDHHWPHKPWLCPTEPQIEVLTASCSQGRHKNLWETQGLSGALRPPPLPDGPEHGGRCELHCRASWPSSTDSRTARSGQSREKPKRRGWAQGMGNGVFHRGQQQIQGGEAETSQVNTEANLR